MPTHAVVWIDHTEARVFHVQPEAPGHVQPEPIDETTITLPAARSSGTPALQV